MTSPHPTSPPRYPWRALPQLAAHIENHRTDEAHGVLDELLAIVANAPTGGLTLRKLRCAQIASACVRGAHRGGAASEQLLDDHYDLLESIATVRSSNTLNRRMHDYLDALLAAAGDSRSTDAERAVVWIQRHLTQNLESPRTLAQYARQFGLSDSHLSRTFSESVGRPFSEELRHRRLERACELLRDTDYKIRAIAAKVGINDVSHFVATFRREMLVTPGEYRRRAMNSRPITESLPSLLGHGR